MDLTKGCLIKFSEAVFIGKYPKGKFSYRRSITALIIKDSYGQKRGQHTFTLQVIESDDPSIQNKEFIRRKGRNVYQDCKVMVYPKQHAVLAKDKHKRAKIAKANKINIWKQEGKHYKIKN